MTSRPPTQSRAQPKLETPAGMLSDRAHVAGCPGTYTRCVPHRDSGQTEGKASPVSYVYIHIQIYIYMYIYIYIYIYINIYTCLHIHIHIQIHMCVHIHIHKQIHMPHFAFCLPDLPQTPP